LKLCVKLLSFFAQEDNAICWDTWRNSALDQG
jgi:hypothetical protein